MEWMKNLERVIYYIEHNLDKEISFSETARIACCSSCYFQRMFLVYLCRNIYASGK